eukprot:GHVN01034386.1.p1 GENE.GHVN01034386.1~~GHVN01034386.1.p1  ORF type:complete len:132 (+),score=14.31 GHVN01034386.1:277-672(+)
MPTVEKDDKQEAGDDEEAGSAPLDDADVEILKSYGTGPYSRPIRKVDVDIKEMVQKIDKLCGVRESDSGLAPPSQWDLAGDRYVFNNEQPLQVARCTKIINPGTADSKYIINVKQIAKFVVVSHTCNQRTR